MSETLTRQQKRMIPRAKRRSLRPQNESAEHWRLKRLCRYIAWSYSCWASAPEFIMNFTHKENGDRNTVDFLAVGKVMTRNESILPGEAGYMDPQKYEWAVNKQPQHYLGLIAFECKVSLNDLRAGMVTAGCHKHYCVVPNNLKEDAIRLVPKHVGIIVVGDNKWDSKIVRGARRRDDAMLPVWCYTRNYNPPPEWARFLLSMAVSNTNYAVRWQA